MKDFLVTSCFKWRRSNRGIEILTEALLKSHNVDFIKYPNYMHEFFKSEYEMGPKTTKINDHILTEIAPISIGIPYIEKLFNWAPKVIFDFLRNQTLNIYPNIEFNNYKNIILESGKPVFFIDSIPKSKNIIYRQSDPIELILSNNNSFIELEHKVLERADLVLTVNKKIMSFYKNNYPKYFSKMKLWKNGFQIPEYQNKVNPYNKNNNAVYLGLSPIDYKLLQFIADNHKDIDFHIIGPYKDKLNYENVKFHGFMNSEQYINYIKFADFAFVPYIYWDALEWVSVTSKFLLFMKFNLPIITMNYGNLKSLEKYGALLVNNKEEFSHKIKDIKKGDFESKHYNINISKYNKKNRINKLDEIFSNNFA